MDGMGCRNGVYKVYSKTMGIYVLCLVLLGTVTSATTTTVAPDTKDTISKTNIPPDNTTISQPDPSSITLRKCKCDKNEYFSGDQCAPKATFVPFYGQNGPFALNTSAFNSVSIGEVICKEGFTAVPLYNEVNGIYLMLDGNLLWQNEQMLIEDYCIEHLEHNIVLGHACIPPPPIPQCCPIGYRLVNDSCEPDTDSSFSPPVYVGNYEMLKQPLEFIRNITCSANENITHVRLNNQEGQLVYNYHEAVLLVSDKFHSANIFEYCVGKKKHTNNTEYVAKLCTLDPILQHQTMCNNRTCIRKCCPKDNLFMGTSCTSAINETEIWQPLFHDYKDLSPTVMTEDWITVYGKPLCSDFFSLMPEDEMEKTYLLTNGSLHVPLYSTSFSAEEYCFDLILDAFNNPKPVALICSPNHSNECQWKQTLIAVLRGVSCLFLTATVLIYLGVPDLRDRTNGRCLVSMSVAMIATHLSILVVTEIPNLNDIECYVAAIVGHMSTLASFFWLNVMCFDMWSTLRSSQQQYHSIKVFSFYSLYAWGSPLVIVLVGLILDLVKPPGVIRPNYLEGTCWFTGNAEFWTYLLGIIVVLVVINLLFFAHVAVLLSNSLKQRKAMVLDGNKANKTKAQVWLYVKLFIVMGVMWITEILSSLHERNECKYWVATDIINALQGVFIFLVAIINKDNIKKIRSAWNPRVEGVRKSLLRLRRGSTPANNYSLSDASRKTSVTSIPRKLSAVSNHLLGNKNRMTPTAINENDEYKNTPESPASYRLSPNTSEMVPMTPLPE